MKTFTEYLNENQNVQDVVLTTIGVIAQLHIWHITTKSYKDHVVIEELYTALQSQVDELAEQYIGSGYTLEMSRGLTLEPYYDETKFIDLINVLQNSIHMSLGAEVAPSEGLKDSLIGMQKQIKSSLYKMDMTEV